MIIDCIGDLHGLKPILPGGDVLILAGDYTAEGKLNQWDGFFRWLKDQPYHEKILIAGNHDNLFERGFPQNQKEADKVEEVMPFLDTNMDFEYLCDSGMGMVINGIGLKIWGTPWTPTFDGVNPKCMAFMETESFLDSKFSLIPDDIDLLITHGPMRHILDANKDGYACGSTSLRKHIDRVKPRFHIFGHIHEQGGQQLMYKHQGRNTWCINCSYIERDMGVETAIRLKIEAK